MSKRSRRKRRLDKLKEEVSVVTTKHVDEKDLAPLVIYDELCYKKIMHWIDKSPVEISGLGLVEMRDGVAYVIDACVLAKGSSVETEIDAHEMGKAINKHDMTGKPGEYRVWWHSHVWMPCNWSGTDYACIEDTGSKGWIIATVFNKKREHRTCYYSVNPVKVFIDDISTKIMPNIPMETILAWDSEFDLVKEPVVEPLPIPRRSLQQYSSYGSYETKEEVYISTTGLTSKVIQEIEELRTSGWEDYDIASYMGLMDSLVWPNTNQSDSDFIETMRSYGVPETDIESMHRFGGAL